MIICQWLTTPHKDHRRAQGKALDMCRRQETFIRPITVTPITWPRNRQRTNKVISIQNEKTSSHFLFHLKIKKLN